MHNKLKPDKHTHTKEIGAMEYVILQIKAAEYLLYMTTRTKKRSVDYTSTSTSTASVRTRIRKEKGEQR
jgi:hypothetical protein